MVRLTSLKTGVDSCQVRSRKKFGAAPSQPWEDSSKAAKDSFSPTWPADHQQFDSDGSAHFDAHLPAASSPPPADARPASGRDERLETAVAAAATAPAAAGVATGATPDPQQQQQQQPQKIVLPASVQCPIVTIYSALRGGLLGFGFGAISGAWQAYQFGAFDGYS